VFYLTDKLHLQPPILLHPKNYFSVMNADKPCLEDAKT